MKLYIVRHGEAVDKFIDENRPLSEKGEQDINQMAINLGQRRVTVDWVLHSGINRAKQTAERLVEQVLHHGEPEIEALLAPEADIIPLANRLNEVDSNGMIVGHLPHLGIFTAHLLSQVKEAPVINFQPGTIYCLEKDENCRWQFCWKLDP